MEIYFDGYCPESLLKGTQAEMRLNEDDFWESEATGLQMTVFPPFATILKWRGRGKFTQASPLASDTYTGLVLTFASKSEGKETLPDEENLINSKAVLKKYLEDIFADKEAFEAAKYDLSLPTFIEHEQYLSKLPKADLQQLIQQFERVRAGNDNYRSLYSEDFREFHRKLYDLKLVFNFNWMYWRKGWKDTNNTGFDYKNSSLLELSMYLTLIFRSDRFCEGSLEISFRSGVIDRIFDRLATIVES